MIEWGSRMRDNHTVKVLKTVIPFFDVAVGEHIDVEGLLVAVRPFAHRRECPILDMILQFFQMRRMMDMMQMVQDMRQMFQCARTGEGDGQKEDRENGNMSPAMFEMLKSMVPPEQQDMMDVVSAMMTMSEPIEQPVENEQKESGDEPVDL